MPIQTNEQALEAAIEKRLTEAVRNSKTQRIQSDADQQCGDGEDKNKSGAGGTIRVGMNWHFF